MKNIQSLIAEWREHGGKISVLSRSIGVTPKAIWSWQKGGGVRMCHYEAVLNALKKLDREAGSDASE